jgi:hypothetical protein
MSPASKELQDSCRPRSFWTNAEAEAEAAQGSHVTGSLTLYDVELRAPAHTDTAGAGDGRGETKKKHVRAD